MRLGTGLSPAPIILAPRTARRQAGGEGSVSGVPTKQTINTNIETKHLATNNRRWLSPRTGFPADEPRRCFARLALLSAVKHAPCRPVFLPADRGPRAAGNAAPPFVKLPWAQIGSTDEERAEQLSNRCQQVTATFRTHINQRPSGGIPIKGPGPPGSGSAYPRAGTAPRFRLSGLPFRKGALHERGDGNVTEQGTKIKGHVSYAATTSPVATGPPFQSIQIAPDRVFTNIAGSALAPKAPHRIGHG